jgi:hypothetical protein
MYAASQTKSTVWYALQQVHLLLIIAGFGNLIMGILVEFIQKATIT